MNPFPAFSGRFNHLQIALARKRSQLKRARRKWRK